MDRFNGDELKKFAKKFVEADDSAGQYMFPSRLQDSAKETTRMIGAAGIAAGLTTSPAAAEKPVDRLGLTELARASNVDSTGAKKESVDARLFENLLKQSWSYNMPDTAKDQQEVVCLARNMWYEAANQGIEGIKAVALVTLSRVLSKRYPNSVCGVVYQHLQYSWTLDPKKRDVDPVSAGFKKVTEIAKDLYTMKDDPTKLATAIESLGLTSDTLFYKRHDWDENDPSNTKMSESNKWFWRECVEAVPGPNGDGRIGDHRFYRAKAKYCKKAAGRKR